MPEPRPVVEEGREERELSAFGSVGTPQGLPPRRASLPLPAPYRTPAPGNKSSRRRPSPADSADAAHLTARRQPARAAFLVRCADELKDPGVTDQIRDDVRVACANLGDGHRAPRRRVGARLPIAFGHREDRGHTSTVVVGGARKHGLSGVAESSRALRRGVASLAIGEGANVLDASIGWGTTARSRLPGVVEARTQGANRSRGG